MYILHGKFTIKYINSECINYDAEYIGAYRNRIHSHATCVPNRDILNHTDSFIHLLYTILLYTYSSNSYIKSTTCARRDETNFVCTIPRPQPSFDKKKRIWSIQTLYGKYITFMLLVLHRNIRVGIYILILSNYTPTRRIHVNKLKYNSEKFYPEYIDFTTSENPFLKKYLSHHYNV